ncbi:hypothetical protein K443DRAFT_636039 [Laccaria amethystina LaAM-08-1]|uniref:Uncharacterized protein n=1 Tax=Laccaria amethystina LaAM-08-1 TaxID=1095629 RepID=A0A0C9WK90_9AGAR|nr:hypothetical protein K443DRAFT_636039 [Laccaria amethystina LaAM-08-1]
MDAIADRAGDFFEPVIACMASFHFKLSQRPRSCSLYVQPNILYTLFSFFDGSSIADKLSSIRKLYDIGNIPNQVPDGTLPFAEDQSSLLQSLSLHFIDVSFKYPGSESYALRHVSFKF